MRIHTDRLDPKDIIGLAPAGVSVHIVSKHSSRKRDHAFEVALRGHRADHRRAPQGRVTDDPSSEKAATYDDWGIFLAGLYGADFNMIAGPYTDRRDFNRQTKNKYMP